MVTNIWSKSGKRIAVALLAFTALLAAGCDSKPVPEGCRIDGPRHLMPGGVALLRVGMTKDKVESILSETAAYSPVEGQYYFSTGGNCPLDDTGGVAPCGVVAEFHALDQGGAGTPPETLERCWWGAIGE